MNKENRSLISKKYINLGLGANILLAIAKTFFGIVGHSSALLADGINSISDVAYYIIVKIFVMIADTPPDKEHPYGHYQMESIAAVIVGAFVMTTGIAIFWTSINTIFDYFSGSYDFEGANIIVLFIALGTIAIKILLSKYTIKAARKIKNPALVALAYDHRNDIIATTAATIGIILGRLGLPWLDPLASCLVAIVILKTGVKIIQDSSNELMDAIPSKILEDQIIEIVKEIPEIIAVEEIGAHRFGPYLMLNLVIGLNGKKTVEEGDKLATMAEELLFQKIELVKKIYIHYHPYSKQINKDKT